MSRITNLPSCRRVAFAKPSSLNPALREPTPILFGASVKIVQSVGSTVVEMNEVSRLHLGMAVLDIASTPVGRVVSVDRSRFEVQLFSGERCWLSEAALFVVRASRCAELICNRRGLATYIVEQSV